MLIQEVGFELGPVVGGLTPEALRPGVVHCTSIIRDLENTALNPGKFKPDHELSAEEVLQLEAYRLMGHLWEDVFSHAFAHHQMIPSRNVVEQESLALDGISLTPDAMDIRNWVLEEYKCTWRSSARIANLQEDFWAWFVQIKAYCYALKCRKARLFVLFVNNDWAPPKPKPRRFDMEFSERELEMNWAMLVQHRGRMLAQ